MEVKITQRDKWLLQGLSVFVFLAAMLFWVILPLRSANLEWKNRYRIQQEQMERSRQWAGELPEIQREYEQCKKKLEQVLRGYYPLLDTHEIDGLLTEFVAGQGILIRKLCMEEQKFWKEDHICAVTVTMELAGASEKLQQLLDNWEKSLYGSRILAFSWEDRKMEGSEEQVLHLQAAVFMSREKTGLDQEWKNRKVEQDGKSDFRD